MVAWGAIGSAIATGAKTVGAGIGKVGSFLGKNAGTIAQLGLGAGSLFGGMSSSSSDFDIGSSMALMDYQNKLQKDYSQWLNENSYTHMRTGLEKAGYNPLLALGATPQSGSIGLGAPISSNTASFDGEKAVSSLLNMANIANVKANTDVTLLGKLGKLLGTKFGNKVSGIIDGLLKGMQNTAKFNDKIEDAGTGVLKGYVSNTSKYDYAPEYDNLGKLPKELSRYKY